ncbi:MAG TPA: zinc-dependent metalloprotease [Dermatophilaceae bacterium]|nr:zinc-dependent metalloprotease [Dermatophilaceae bacterium]
MSDHPHQGPTDPDEPDEPDLAAMLASLFGGVDNPEVASALAAMGIDKMDRDTMAIIGAQLKSMFSSDPVEPFNVELATDVARKSVAAEGDSVVGDVARREVEQAVEVAHLWIDAVTDLPAPAGAVHAWSRAEWVDQTMPMWRELVEPVAAGVSTAVVAAMRSQMGRLEEGEDFPAIPGLPAGIDPSAVMGQVEPMLARMSGTMFGVQVGQAVGALAGTLVSGTDVGLPLVPGHGVALLPANIATFAEGLEVDLTEVRLYLAVREAARVRLFAEVAWLGPQLVAAVQAYARDISIDTEGIETALQSIDPSDPDAMQSALSNSLFTPEPSPAQRAALVQLETYLALVEGWVAVVADRATSKHLPHPAALDEAVRRQRASAGPAGQIFSQLVGLELHPRRLRDAANLWAALEAKGGASARDSAWAHPDVAPTAADLDDPLGYVDRFMSRGTRDEMDAALDAMLSEGERGNKGVTGEADTDKGESGKP